MFIGVSFYIQTFFLHVSSDAALLVKTTGSSYCLCVRPGTLQQSITV